MRAANPIVDNEGYALVRNMVLMKGDVSWVFVGSDRNIKVVAQATGELDAKAAGKLARRIGGVFAYFPSPSGRFAIQIYDTHVVEGVTRYGRKMGQFDPPTDAFNARTARYEIPAGRSNSLRIYGNTQTDYTFVSIWVKK